jgi:hypothetical protein
MGRLNPHVGESVELMLSRLCGVRNGVSQRLRRRQRAQEGRQEPTVTYVLVRGSQLCSRLNYRRSEVVLVWSSRKVERLSKWKCCERPACSRA